MHPPADNTPTPIIIDTDMAPDDWMAILYLLQTSIVELKAITVVATGEAHARPGTRNAIGLLALNGNNGVPVACGRKTPLKGDHKWPLMVRKLVDWRFGLSLPRGKQKASHLSAVQLLSEQLLQSSRKVAVLALGPLTNLAEAIQQHPEIIEKIECVVLMGGAVNVPGNITPSGFKMIENHTAEWNIYCDPYAASVVFASKVPVTLVPLDVTNTVPMTWDFFNRLGQMRLTPAAEFVYRTMGRLKYLIDRHEYYFWDPLAAVLTTRAGLGDYAEMNLKIETQEGPNSGRTFESDDGHIVQVCTGVDKDRFENLFLETLNSIVSLHE
jgi:pyrimidine-specific ribonucleoside hydrolase